MLFKNDKLVNLKFYSIIELNKLSDAGEMEIELITTAKQTDPRYGDFSYEKKDLEQMAKNFNDDVVGIKIAVDLNHDEDKIALAWLKAGSMRVAESTKSEGTFSLYGVIDDFTPKGSELVRTGAVKYFSLEIQPKFTKFVNSVKKTFNNVIRGLALTNRPVIKDMAPTFSENNLIINNTSCMKNYQIFLSQLKTQEIVTLTEKETLGKMFTELSEEEQTEVKADTEEVKAKPEEAKKDDDTKDDDGKKDDDDKKDDDAKGDDPKLAEIKIQLNEQKSQTDKALAELRRRDLSEVAKTLLLSDEKAELTFGFIKDSEKSVVDFLMSLSDQQVEAFKSLWENAKAVDFSENGVDSKGTTAPKKSKQFADQDQDVDAESVELDNKVKALMEKDTKIGYEEALGKVSQEA